MVKFYSISELCQLYLYTLTLYTARGFVHNKANISWSSNENSWVWFESWHLKIQFKRECQVYCQSILNLRRRWKSWLSNSIFSDDENAEKRRIASSSATRPPLRPAKPGESFFARLARVNWDGFSPSLSSSIFIIWLLIWALMGFRWEPGVPLSSPGARARCVMRK